MRFIKKESHVIVIITSSNGSLDLLIIRASNGSFGMLIILHHHHLGLPVGTFPDAMVAVAAPTCGFTKVASQRSF